MKFAIISVLGALVLAACSNGSGSGGSGGLRQANLVDEKEISAAEYGNQRSSWSSQGCTGGFAENLIGNVFRRETQTTSPRFSVFSQTTERVTSATPNEVVLEQTYDVLNVPGLSGPIYVNNRSQNICRYTAGPNGSSLECNTSGQLTPEAENYVRNLPEDPDKDCEFKNTASVEKSKFYSGSYIFENGLKVPALRSEAVIINNYDCKGRIEARRMTMVVTNSNAVKPYPDETGCVAELYSHYTSTNPQGRVMFDSETRALVSPKK